MLVSYVIGHPQAQSEQAQHDHKLIRSWHRIAYFAFSAAYSADAHQLLQKLMQTNILHDISNLSLKIIHILSQHGERISAAESCTGGKIALSLASIPGASAVHQGGIVAYTQDIKERLLHVDPKIIEHFGIVSPQTALAMACGIGHIMQTEWAVSTTGYAGPSGGDSRFPVGTVCIGVYAPKYCIAHAQAYFWNLTRPEIIESAANQALNLLYSYMHPVLRDASGEPQSAELSHLAISHKP